MDAKEKLVFSHNLMGTGMWALGYDDAHPELWQLLQNNFYHPPDTLMLDNFEGSCGHFYRPPAYSGSTQGIAESSSADTSRESAGEGEYALRIYLGRWTAIRRLMESAPAFRERLAAKQYPPAA
ncbi:MAG: hypothetical protein U5N26_02990 [Candidatus Marinimicrobia bacterium]|nr:hypothetical protein [Candidatus Neomarinimicrobiota bacterium]